MSQDNLMKYVPVEVNKWAEMVQAMTRVKELEADLEKSDGVVWTLTIENTHLKAELTDLKSTADRFKAEVESLMTNPTSRLLRAEREENARLKAEVERLTKAGDEMALNLTHIGWNICVEAWNAAKEGKQS
jgi:predicted RNase H-like nuclease (RuvC/YqgF family)